ncbi:MAG: substrate-binding domain-containing protein [Lentisphaeria bacterium]|nr:substrate-binding domain-containing protein [Lentisphaeria bacterium]
MAITNRRGRRADLRDALRDRIIADFPAGTGSGKLPPAAALARRYGAGAGTVRRALGEIAAARMSGAPSGGRRVALLAIGRVPPPAGTLMTDYGEVCKGMTDTLNAAGGSLTTHCLGLDEQECLQEIFRRNNRLAVLVTDESAAEVYRFLAGTGFIRLMGSPDPECPGPHLTTDQAAVGRLAAGYLTGRGCRSFLFLGNAERRIFRERRDAFIAALPEAAEQNEIRIDFNRLDGNGIISLIEAWLQDPARRSRLPELGIFCGGDALLLPLYRAMAACRIDPAEVAVVSTDQNPHYMSHVFPVPAGIDIGMYETGVRAARAALTGAAPGVVLTAPRLVLPHPEPFMSIPGLRRPADV